MFKSFASRIRKRIRSNRTRLLLGASTAILAAIAFTLASVAANDAIPPRSSHAQASPSQRFAAAVNSTSSRENRLQVLNAGLWRTDAGFNDTIRVTNLLVVGPLEVVPVLYMADGTRYEVSSLELRATGGVRCRGNQVQRP